MVLPTVYQEILNVFMICLAAGKDCTYGQTVGAVCLTLEHYCLLVDCG